MTLYTKTRSTASKQYLKIKNLSRRYKNELPRTQVIDTSTRFKPEDQLRPKSEVNPNADGCFATSMCANKRKKEVWGCNGLPAQTWSRTHAWTAACSCQPNTCAHVSFISVEVSTTQTQHVAMHSSSWGPHRPHRRRSRGPTLRRTGLLMSTQSAGSTSATPSNDSNY